MSHIIGTFNPNSSQRRMIYDKNDTCPTLQAAMGAGGGNVPLIVEKVWCCASRGRDPENPSNRRPGINLEQRLEINHDGICNCITSVAKDSYVLEKCMVSENGSDRGSKETP